MRCRAADARKRQPVVRRTGRVGDRDGDGLAGSNIRLVDLQSWQEHVQVLLVGRPATGRRREHSDRQDRVGGRKLAGRHERRQLGIADISRGYGHAVNLNLGGANEAAAVDGEGLIGSVRHHRNRRHGIDHGHGRLDAERGADSDTGFRCAAARVGNQQAGVDKARQRFVDRRGRKGLPVNRPGARDVRRCHRGAVKVFETAARHG